MAYPHGLFSWTDISLPDPQAGRDFYAQLFGWDAEDQHAPDGTYIYTGFYKTGKPVAGLSALPSGTDTGGFPPIWNSYVTVDDVDMTIDRWLDAGGAVIMPAMNVMTAGRMAFVADPEGAVLALWQAGDSVGGEVFGEHGAPTWNELNTRNSGAARAFYGEAIGWEFERFEGEVPMEYWVIKLDAKESGQPYRDDKMNGGILTMDDNWPPEIPAHWMVYFQVDDTDEIVDRLTQLGGTVSIEPFDSTAGRIAIVADPQGGTFSVIAP